MESLTVTRKTAATTITTTTNISCTQQKQQQQDKQQLVKHIQNINQHINHMFHQHSSRPRNINLHISRPHNIDPKIIINISQISLLIKFKHRVSIQVSDREAEMITLYPPSQGLPVSLEELPVVKITTPVIKITKVDQIMVLLLMVH